MYNRADLWVAIERKEDASTRRNTAQLARELILALPTELGHAKKQSLVRGYVQAHFVVRGMVADIAYHDFDKHNPHAHVLLTLREILPEGFGKKDRSWNKRELVKQWREEWANHVNRQLEQEGHDARIDHRSLKDRGIEREPQIHLGPIVIEMERKGIQTEMGDTYRAIAAANDNRYVAALAHPETQSIPDAEELVTSTLDHVERQQDKEQGSNLSTEGELIESERSLSSEFKKINKDNRNERSLTSLEESAPQDERALIHQWQQYREQGPERGRPQDASPWEEARSWGLDDVTLRVLRTYSGHQAKHERERRIDSAISTSEHGRRVERSPLATYLSGLGQRLKEKGRGYLRLADSWLAERLARHG